LLIKLYRQVPGGEKRYSPAECIGARRSLRASQKAEIEKWRLIIKALSIKGA
jgi:hypothetical protein